MIQLWWHEGQNTLDVVQSGDVTYTFYQDVGFWTIMDIEDFKYNELPGWVMIGEI